MGLFSNVTTFLSKTSDELGNECQASLYPITPARKTHRHLRSRTKNILGVVQISSLMWRRVIRDCYKTRPVHVRTGYQARPAPDGANGLLNGKSFRSRY